jgi:hypothetical protein
MAWLSPLSVSILVFVVETTLLAPSARAVALFADLEAVSAAVMAACRQGVVRGGWVGWGGWVV